MKLTMRVLIVVRAVVDKIETLVVLHLLEAEMNQDLYGVLCSVGSHFIVGTFILSDAAIN